MRTLLSEERAQLQENKDFSHIQFVASPIKFSITDVKEMPVPKEQ